MSIRSVEHSTGTRRIETKQSQQRMLYTLFYEGSHNRAALHLEKKFLKSHKSLFEELIGAMRDKLGERMNEYLIPPPIFVEMRGEFVDIDLESGSLSAKFPILETYRNPYGTMQGGMIATAVDNTIGPLSVAIAPLNVTRTLEMKYRQPVKPEMKYIVIKANLTERKDPKIYFKAVVSSPDGQRLAECKAVHWIIENHAV